MDLTKGQIEAVSKAKKWFLTANKEYFEIAGYAGTGKSTVVNYLIDELGLDKGKDVAFATFTGKASLVLNLKGVPATTIHKLIYYTKQITEKISVKDKDNNDLKDDNGEIVYKEIKKIVSEKKESLQEEYKLIVIDEASMINDKIMKDLLSFKVPIIFLGDPGQLPPVNGKNNLFEDPDIFLTEIMRTNEDNPIVFLSKEIREKGYIKYGRYGKNVLVCTRDEIPDSVYLNADILLVSTNNMRDSLNKKVRELKGYENDKLYLGEKIICRKNQWELEVNDIPLVNGTIGYLVNNPSIVKYIPTEEDKLIREIIGEEHFDEYIDEVKKEYEKKFKNFYSLDFKPDFSSGEYFKGLKVHKDLFNPSYKIRSKALEEERMNPNNVFEFGYAITIHMSQGSSWKNVYADIMKFRNMDKSDYIKLAYTAITRSEQKLIVVK